MLRTRLISPYQHTGVAWLTRRERAPDYPGGFLCDEMGLGKTVQLLATMIDNPLPRTLIVVPKSLVSQWVTEIAKFAPHFNVHVFDGPKRIGPIFRTAHHITIAPYSVVGDGTLAVWAWDRIILDEAHEIRNKKSKTYKDLQAIKSRVRWLVTGTPVFNSVRDFVALAGFLGIPQDYVQGYLSDVRAKYVLRRTKDDLGARLQLPPCDFDNLELEMYPEERQLYSDVYLRAQGIVREIFRNGAEGMHQMEILEALLRVRQAMTWPQLYLDGVARKDQSDPEVWTGRSKKHETLMELLHSHPTEKSLVFTQFMGEMDRLQELVHGAGIPVFRIDGGVDKDQRAARIQGFRKCKGGAVFLIQIKAGGVGLNLQEATRVYITTPAWNPATELQAIGRAHRTGQEQVVTVRKLVYVGEETLPSIEQSIMQLQGHKAQVCAQVLNDPRLEQQIPTLPKGKITVQSVKKIFSV
jgi:SNF2 family DNA or RNA helicase